MTEVNQMGIRDHLSFFSVSPAPNTGVVSVKKGVSQMNELELLADLVWDCYRIHCGTERMMEEPSPWLFLLAAWGAQGYAQVEMPVRGFRAVVMHKPLWSSLTPLIVTRAQGWGQSFLIPLHKWGDPQLTESFPGAQIYTLLFERSSQRAAVVF